MRMYLRIYVYIKLMINDYYVLLLHPSCCILCTCYNEYIVHIIFLFIVTRVIYLLLCMYNLWNPFSYSSN